MLTEIESAVNFLINALTQRLTDISEEKFVTLRKRLTELLQKRFENHWYQEKPMKGSAYRCMNISIDDGSVDSVLSQAGEEVGISKKRLISVFSKGLALWVDPNDVSCRLGKGAIFPISRKIAEPKSLSTFNLAPTNPQRRQQRPQQRPRSISPPTFTTVPYSSQQQSRPRSTTPPGFSSSDAGQMYQTLPKKNYSIDNLHKLWDTIPNTSSYVPLTNTSSYVPSSAHYQRQQPTASYSSARSFGQNDAVYSFNQYSSYYTPGSLWKKNNYQTTKQPKQTWQDDEAYNKHHWSRNERSMTSTTQANAYGHSNLSYGYSPTRYAQEVC